MRIREHVEETPSLPHRLPPTFMCEGYELPGAAGGAEAGGGGGGGGAEAVGEELTAAALMESNVTSLKAAMSSGLQEETCKFKKKHLKVHFDLAVFS